MPRNSLRSRPSTLSLAICFALCSWAGSTTAQNPSAGSENRLNFAQTSPTRLENRSVADEEAEPSIASAEVIEGSSETELVLRGNAQLRRTGTVIEGDTITYTQATDEVRAVGNAKVARRGATVESPEITYRLDSKTGEAKEAEFSYPARRLRGSAGCARFASADVTEFEDALFTTCAKDAQSWWVEINRLTLDEYDQEGYGTGAVLKFGGVPVFGSPWFTFPLANQRKSGLLTPTLGISTTRGVDVAIPYYFNLAPNYDYTLTPRVMSKRGVMLGNEFRLKTEVFEGDINVNYLPDDRVTKDDRHSIQGTLRGSWRGFGFGTNYNRVSDDDFSDDFSANIRESNDNVLAQDYWLTYGSRYWNAAARVSKNQTLKNTDKPYEKIPQLTWNAYFADEGGFELSTKIEATRFAHPTKIEGDRIVLHQTLAYPMVAAGWFVTPKAELIHTNYNLERSYYTGSSDNPSLTVPVFSLDSGLFFDRDLNVSKTAMRQTLEPRIYYSYTPYRNQSAIPVFDSSLSDFNFASILSPNLWSGYDRIAETNQVSTTITTRFLTADSGVEIAHASIGQRYYFNDMTVAYNGTRQAMTDQKANLLASFGAKLTREISVVAANEWSYERRRSQRLSGAIRWQPKPMSVISLAYRYNWEPNQNSEDYIKQVDLSTQWPITDRLYALARLNYSLHDSKFIENMIGFEYHADCWTLRTVAQRYIRDNDRRETNYYVQLELTGLGSIGSSPLSELQRSIQGYQTRSPVPSQIGTYDYYQ